MPTINASTMPPQILAQIQKPPLLKGESPQEYYDMLGGLVSDIAPADFVEWLWLIDFLDCAWEILRNRRYRAIVIDLHRAEAFCSILKKTGSHNRLTDSEKRERYAHWLKDPQKYDIDADSVPALAFLHAASSLEIIDKGLERLVRRCDTIVQQLEYRREMFAHRARRAADNVLTAENVQHPRIASSGAPRSMEPAHQTPSSQTPITITPGTSPEFGASGTEGGSHEINNFV